MDKKSIKWCLASLNKYKVYFGFTDYKIFIRDSTDTELFDFVAEAKTDYLDKSITFVFYKKFMEEDRDRLNVIIHELVHARIGIASDKTADKTQQIEYFEQEEAVNDITRGFLQMKFTLPKKRKNKIKRVKK